jgi:hypothetical protein
MRKSTILVFASVVGLGVLFSQVNAQAATYGLLSRSAVSGWITDRDGRTTNKIATAHIGNNLYIAVRGLDNKIYTRCFCNLVVGQPALPGPWTAVGNGLTYDAVGMAAFNGRIYQAVRGTDSKIYTRSSTDGVNWSGWVVDNASNTPDAVTMATFNGRLYQAARGTGNKIFTRSTSDGTNWTSWNEAGGTSPNPIGMAGTNGRLVQAVRGSTDSKIYFRSSTDGTNWSPWTRDDASYTPDAVDVSTVRYYGSDAESFNMLARGTGDRVYMRQSGDGRIWSPWVLVEDYLKDNTTLGPVSDVATTPSTPTLAKFQISGEPHHRIVFFVRGFDNHIYWI